MSTYVGDVTLFYFHLHIVPKWLKNIFHYFYALKYECCHGPWLHAKYWPFCMRWIVSIRHIAKEHNLWYCIWNTFRLGCLVVEDIVFLTLPLVSAWKPCLGLTWWSELLISNWVEYGAVKQDTGRSLTEIYIKVCGESVMFWRDLIDNTYYYTRPGISVTLCE